MAARFYLECDQDQKKVEQKSKRNRVNPDEFQVKSFILKHRKANPYLSRGVMVDKIIKAVGVSLKLTQKYRPSTYKQWDRDADPIKDMKAKLSRPKSKNR